MCAVEQAPQARDLFAVGGTVVRPLDHQREDPADSGVSGVGPRAESLDPIGWIDRATDQRPQRAAMRRDQLELVGHGRLESRGDGALGQIGCAGPELLGNPPIEGHRQRFFRRVIFTGQFRGNASSRGDISHGRGGVSTLGEQLEGGV